MRISVELILSLLAQGVATEEILADYPDLEPEDILACIAIESGERPSTQARSARRYWIPRMAEGNRECVLLLKADAERVSIRIQPDVPFGNFQRALQRALDLAALAMKAIPAGEEHPEFGESFPLRHFGSRLSIEALEEEYAPWIIGHTITDIVESLEPLLADLIKICRLADLVSTRSAVAKKRVERALSKMDFDKEPLGPKLDRLAREAPGVLTADLKSALMALNKLRVCFTHAGGRVRESDCRPKDTLEVSCALWDFFVEYGDGTREPVRRDMVTKADGWIVMCRNREPLTFKVGEKIRLGEHGLFRIAATVFEMVLGLRSNLYAHLRKTWAEELKEEQLRWTLRALFEDAPSIPSNA